MYNSWVNSGDNTEKFCTDGTFVLSHNNTANQSQENSPNKDSFQQNNNSQKNENFKIEGLNNQFQNFNKKKLIIDEYKINNNLNVFSIPFNKTGEEGDKLIEPKPFFNEDPKKILNKKKENSKKNLNNEEYMNFIKNNRNLSNDIKKLSAKGSPEFKSKNFKKLKNSLDKKSLQKKGILFEKLHKNSHYKTMNPNPLKNNNNHQPQGLEKKNDLKFTKLKNQYKKSKIKSSRENIHPTHDETTSTRKIKKSHQNSTNEREFNNYNLDAFDLRFKSLMDNTFTNGSTSKFENNTLTEYKYYKEKNNSFKNNL